MIDRVALVQRHNPKLNKVDLWSPLSVGNGEFAFTADVTGMQSIYNEYKEAKMPLCTMAQWGWHTTPFSEEAYLCDRSKLIETEYDNLGRKVYYPVKCAEGNEKVYHWLRQNPHKCNLVRIGMVERGEEGFTEWTGENLSKIQQELHMEVGYLDSSFQYQGKSYEVHTYAPKHQDGVAFEVKGEAFKQGKTAVLLAFPYADQSISGADWDNVEGHSTVMNKVAEGVYTFMHRMNQDAFFFVVKTSKGCAITEESPHTYLLTVQGQEQFDFSVMMVRTSKKPVNVEEFTAKAYQTLEVIKDTTEYWTSFWNTTGVVELYKSKDKRALELERRIVLSQYLMAINSSGSVPPQETGLTCNSWFGKPHLEMYFWHEAYLPLFGRRDLLEPSLDWFLEYLPEFRKNAAKNGYKGARWTKMVGEDAVDSPSKIAPLLVWQQPHLIYMIYQAYMQNQDKDFLEKYYTLISESADFMADFAELNEEGTYELVSPLIPVQERHAPEITKNPVFEVEYWVLTLRMAMKCAEILGKTYPESWKQVAEHMIPSPQEHGYYLAHSNCPETYEKFAEDHPSMLMAYGVIDSGRMDSQVMAKSLEKVLETWDEKSLWGWDFAVIAMTAVRLGNPELAIEMLLKETYKNVYVASGNNRQISRDDLPLYLPGNGSLLLAVAMMTAGYTGCTVETPGFPKDGMWTVEYEGISPLVEK